MDWKKLEELSKAIAKSHWATTAGFTAGMIGFAWTVAVATGADGKIKKYLRVWKKDDEDTSHDHPISEADARALGH